MSQIDEHAKSIFEKISKLESETKGFDEAKFEEKIKELNDNIKSKEKERKVKHEEVIKFTNKFKEITASETILETYSIKNEEELVSIQNDIEAKEKKLQLADSGKLEEMSQIDEHAKSIFEKISKLESETKGFDEAKFEEKIKELKEKRYDKEDNDKNWGIVENQIKTTEK